MPEGLPERKLDSASEAKREHEDFARRTKLDNSKPMDPKRWKNQPTPSDALIAKFKTDLLAARTSLGAIRTRDKTQEYTKTRLGDPSACTGDLAGLWNDFRLDLQNDPVVSVETVGSGDKEKRVQTDWPYQRLLDCLSLVGKSGDLESWLDQWAVAVRGKSVDWLQLSDIGAAIARNIEFTQQFLADYFAKLEKSHLDGDSVALIDAVVEEANGVLTAIAVQIDREAGEVLAGTRRLESMPGRFEALQVTLTRYCDQSRRAEAIRERVEQLDVVGALKVEVNSNDLRTWLGDVTPALRDFEAAAQAAQSLASGLTRGVDPGAEAQQATADAAVDALVAAAEALGTVLTIEAPRASTEGFDRSGTGVSRDVFARDAWLANVSAVGSAVLEKHIALGRQFSDPTAKGSMLKGAAARKLGDVLQQIDAFRIGNFYSLAEKAASGGGLRDFWNGHKSDLLDKLQGYEKANGGTAAGVAAKEARESLDKLFTGGLGPLLDKWKSRAPADTHGLAWQLTAALRSYRKGIEAILPASVLRRAIDQVLDALLATVAAGVKADARSATS